MRQIELCSRVLSFSAVGFHQADLIKEYGAKGRMFKTRVFVLILLILFSRFAVAQDKHLSIAILSVDPAQMAVYSELFDSFRKANPSIAVQLDFYSDARYKIYIEQWLEQGTYDLLYWQGGRRLSSLVNADLITPIEALLDKEALNQSYQIGSLREASIRETLYALPIGHYAWGIYYNKDIFSRYEINEPKNWKEFIALCEKIKSKGTYPLVQAKKDHWPLLGWLDYLAIEAGDIALREVLVSDNPVSAEQALAITRLLKPLWENDYLFARDHDWEWSQTIPAVVREKAAMTFMAQFAESVIAPQFAGKLGYFPFPVTNESDNTVQIAPLDVWVVPNSSVNRRDVRTLLEYLSQPKIHHKLSIDIGFLPVSKREVEQEIASSRLRRGLKQLQDASQHIQYFDRDAPQGYSLALAQAMNQSIMTASLLPLEQALIADKTNKAAKHEWGNPEKVELTFATYTGIPLTYDISARLRRIYEQLDVDISIRRYSNLTLLNNEELATLDGELARSAEINVLSSNFVRIEEPIWHIHGYLFCREKAVCNSWDKGGLEGKNIGDTLAAPRVKQWYDDNGFSRKLYTLSHQMVADLQAGKIDAVLMLERDVKEFKAELIKFNRQQLFVWPVYHYLHKRHSDLIKPFTKHLIELKSDPLSHGPQSSH